MLSTSFSWRGCEGYKEQGRDRAAGWVGFNAVYGHGASHQAWRLVGQLGFEVVNDGHTNALGVPAIFPKGI